ncbi:MAG TPA: nuclear transport factor 2 family protein [Thermoleophilia bacterium]|nr:nuclear transport factor 2 family protein [Thermoleophilia bacterium]
MLDTTRIDDWLERYRGAWATDDPAEVGRLFADDVRYFTAPFAEPLEGIDEVTAYWLGEAESGIPWSFDHEVLAREGDLFVVRAVTRYPEGTRDAGGRREVFHNLWLVTVTDDGRAREFVEYFMLAPDDDE